MGALGGALSAMEDADFIPEEATEPPTEPTPPEGFDDWAEYLLWKCKAAQAVWLEVDRFLMTMQGLGGVEIGVATVAPIIAGFVGASFATMGPVGLVVVVASILAVLAYGVSTLLIVSQLRDWWTDHKIEIVCELYESGDAADALAAIGAFIEDAFQAVTWGAELAPFQTQIKGFLGTALGKLETNSLVNPLFKLVTGVALLEFECPCEQEADTGWHFDEWEEFWVASTYGDPIVVVSNEWSPNPWPPDYLDSSPGCISSYLNPPGSGTYAASGGQWLYTYPVGTGPVCASALWGVRLNMWNDDFSHLVACRLYYTDDTYDNGTWNLKDWSTFTVYTTAPNVGKQVKSIRLRLENNASGHVDGWMRVDNVRLQEW